MKTIAFVDLARSFGGREKRLIDWLRFVDHSSVSVTIVGRQDLYSQLLRNYRVPVTVRTTTLGSSFSIIGAFRWLRLFRDLNTQGIVFMQGDFFDIPLFLVLAGYVATRGNVVISEHLAAPAPMPKSSRLHFGMVRGVGLWWYRQRVASRWRYALARTVLAVSDSVKERLIQWRCPREKIVTIGHGVDLELFCPSAGEKDAFRRSYGIPREAVVIVSTARLEGIKRLDRLTQAFSLLADQCPNLWLVFAGDGSLRDQLSQSMAGNEQVLFLGHLSQWEVAKALQASDIFVLPTDNEGSPMALLEAMAVGLVCIGTNVAGLKDIIRHERNGFLVEPSAQAIASMIERVLSMEDAERGQIVEAALATAAAQKLEAEVHKVLSLLNIPVAAASDHVGHGAI